MGRRALVSAIAGNVAHLVYLPGKLYKRGDGHKCDDDFVSLRIKLLTFDEG